MEPPIFPLFNGHGCCDFVGLMFSLGFSYAFLGIVRFTTVPHPRPRAAVPRFWGAIVFDFSWCAVWLPLYRYLLRFSSQHDPILDPKLASISPSFALLFQITFPTRFPTSFWIDFGPQIDFKIDQKSIKKFFQNQPTNKSYFSFIFNQISKTISCSSKMVDVQKSFQNLMFLYVF